MFAAVGVSQRDRQSVAVCLFCLTPLVFLTWLVPDCCRGQQAAVDWQVGDAYWRQLDQAMSIELAGSPLRGSLNKLMRAQRVCIWLDRRVDPDQRPMFRPDLLPLRDVLTQLAAGLGCETGFLDSVVYIGPPEVASRLATVAAVKSEETQRLPTLVRQRLLARRSWEWADLAAPRDLLESVTREARLTVANPDEVPHDLWPATQLPPLTIPERISLLLAGFSRTFVFERDGAAIRIVAWPESATLVRVHAIRRDQEQSVQELSRRFPKIQVRRAGASLEVTGGYEDQMGVQRWLKGDRPAATGETRYNLKIENQPAGGVIQALAKRLGYRLEVDPAVQDKLRQLVSFQVENATPDEIIERALRDSGIHAQRQGDRLRLSPAP